MYWRSCLYLVLCNILALIFYYVFLDKEWSGFCGKADAVRCPTTQRSYKSTRDINRYAKFIWVTFGASFSNNLQNQEQQYKLLKLQSDQHLSAQLSFAQCKRMPTPKVLKCTFKWQQGFYEGFRLLTHQCLNTFFWEKTNRIVNFHAIACLWLWKLHITQWVLPSGINYIHVTRTHAITGDNSGQNTIS